MTLTNNENKRMLLYKSNGGRLGKRRDLEKAREEGRRQIDREKEIRKNRNEVKDNEENNPPGEKAKSRREQLQEFLEEKKRKEALSKKTTKPVFKPSGKYQDLNPIKIGEKDSIKNSKVTRVRDLRPRQARGSGDGSKNVKTTRKPGSSTSSFKTSSSARRKSTASFAPNNFNFEFQMQVTPASPTGSIPHYQLPEEDEDVFTPKTKPQPSPLDSAYALYLGESSNDVISSKNKANSPTSLSSSSNVLESAYAFFLGEPSKNKPSNNFRGPSTKEVLDRSKDDGILQSRVHFSPDVLSTPRSDATTDVRKTPHPKGGRSFTLRSRN